MGHGAPNNYLQALDYVYDPAARLVRINSLGGHTCNQAGFCTYESNETDFQFTTHAGTTHGCVKVSGFTLNGTVYPFSTDISAHPDGSQLATELEAALVDLGYDVNFSVGCETLPNTSTQRVVVTINNL